MKGIMTESIINLILLGVMILVVLTFVLALPLRTATFASDAPCQSLGLLGKLQHRFSGVSISEASVDALGRDLTTLCPAHRVEVSRSASDERAMKAIAEQMALCHRNYGEGDLSLFAQGRSERNLYCVVCAQISFEEGSEGLIEEFSDYLVYNRVPGRQESYAEYVGNLDSDRFSSASLPQFTMSRELDYGVFFFYGKKTEFFNNRLESVIATATAGTSAGGVSGFVGAVFRGGRIGAIAGPKGAIVGGLMVGGAYAFVGGVGGTAVGSIVPTGSDYAGATVIVPWDEEVLRNDLRCDMIEVSR